MARTIARFEREMDAELARLTLESAGLQAVVMRADFTVLIPMPFSDPAFELLVPDDQTDRALALLSADRAQASAIGEDE